MYHVVLAVVLVDLFAHIAMEQTGTIVKNALVEGKGYVIFAMEGVQYQYLVLVSQVVQLAVGVG